MKIKDLQNIVLLTYQKRDIPTEIYRWNPAVAELKNSVKT